MWGVAASFLALALTALAPGRLSGVVVSWGVQSVLTFVLGNAPLTALLQSVFPNHLQGLALSLFSMIMKLAAPVSLALTVPLGEEIGIRWLIVLMCVLG